MVYILIGKSGCFTAYMLIWGKVIISQNEVYVWYKIIYLNVFGCAAAAAFDDYNIWFKRLIWNSYTWSLFFLMHSSCLYF